MLIVSDDPRGALATAVHLRDAANREPLFLGVRIGIDSGAAVEQDGRYFGSALNIAARVAAHARGGQILCTAQVAAVVSDVSDMRCVALGTVRFKNVSEPVEVFEVVSEQHTSTVADPVCHMHVEAAAAAARQPFNGTTYYFCSSQCAEAFARHPQAYLEP